MQGRDELARVLDDEVGAELERASGSSRPSRTGRRRRCTAAGRAPHRAPQHLDDAIEHARGGGRERDQVGLLGLDQRRDVVRRARRRRAGAPPSRRPRGSRRPSAVPSACSSSGVPGDDRQPPVLRRARQAPREAVEDRLGDGGRVVLLGDVERAHRPAVPDLAQRRLEHARGRCPGSGRPSSSAASTARRARAESRASSAVQERVAVLVDAHRPSGCQETLDLRRVPCRRTMA